MFQSVLTRRELLAMSAATAAALTLPGCGGGGGSTVQSSARSRPEGDLRNQVNQFNTLVETIGLNWQAPSQAMIDADGFLKTRSRADAPPETFFQATYVGLKALRGVQEMFAQAILKLDDMGQLGDSVAANMSNNAGDVLTVKDPLWIGATMHTQHSGMVMVSTAIESFQIAGLGQIMTQADAETNPDDFLVTYSFIADIFNSMVTRQSAAVQMAVDPTWLLNDSETVTSDIARQELDRIESILDRIPWGPGYASRSITRAGKPNPVPVPDDEIPSLIGEFVGKIVDAVKDGKSKDDVIKTITDTAGDYSKRIEINPTGLMKSLGKTLGKDVVKEIMKRVVLKFVKDRGGKDAECAAKLLLDVYDLARAIASVIGTLEVPPLAVIMAGLATIKVIALLQDIEDCTKTQHTPRLIGRIEQIEERRTPYKPHITKIGPIITQTIPHNQRIPDNAEKRRRRCVRVRHKEEVRGKIINYPRSQPSGPQITPQLAEAAAAKPGQWDGYRQQLEVSAVLIPPGRSRLGRADTMLPRTHENMETASAMLLYDLARRNADVMQPAVGNGTLDFTAANVAALFTLEPGTTTFQVPGITNAALAVSAKDFIPLKLDPVDLSGDVAIPALTDLSNAALGVIIHAK